MNAVSKFILFVAAGSTATWFSLSIRAQGIDPATGLPAASTRQVDVNPATGLPMGLTPDDIGQYPFPAGGFASPETLPEVEELMATSKYDDALQLLLDNHRRFKLNDPLAETLLPYWIELSRRFPKAKATLIEIRDQYQNEFYAGRGYQLLFGELFAINSQLHQDNANYALFQSIRKQDRKLAEQCFGIIAPLLVKRGEFDLCLSYVGDPKEYFDSIRANYNGTLVHQHHADLLKRQSDHQMTQIKQQLGLTNQVKPVLNPNYSLPPPLIPFDPVPNLREYAEAGFINQTRQLIEILIGAGRKAEAEDIQGKALAILDDSRLKSAVSDATQQVQKLSSHNP